MRPPIVAPLALALCAAFHGSPASGEVERLGWLAGCWEGRTATRVTHEHWMPPLGGMMLGMSRTVARDTVREFEQLRIETRAGKATYVALPSGQRETAFTATAVSDSSVTFANPAHDFPQEIAYRRAGKDSLVATISGPQGGQTRRIAFPMRRIACGG